MTVTIPTETILTSEVRERAVLYGRTSGIDKTDQTDAQLKVCGDYAARPKKNYQVVARIFEDTRKQTSGSDLDLEGIQRILEMARNREFDVLIVREMDRLSRNLAKQLFIEDELKQCGIRIEYVYSEYDNSPEGELNKNIRAVISHYERLKITERTTRGKRQAVKNGKVLTDKPPFGFLVSEEQKFTIHEPHAEIVRLIFDLYLEPNMAGNGVATRLNEMGIPSPRGKKWSKTTIYKILRETAYIGTWYYGKRYRVKSTKPGHKWQFVENPRDKWIAVEVPSIVDKDTWNRVQEKRGSISAQHTQKKTYEYLLSGGMLKCTCGGAIRATCTINKGKAYQYYMCKSKCGFKVVNVKDLDSKVWNWITKVLSNKERLRSKLELFKQAKPDNPFVQQLEKLEQQIKKTLAEFENAAQNVRAAKGPLAKELFAQELARVEQVMTSQENLKAKLTEKIEAMTLTDAQIGSLLEFANDISFALSVVNNDFDEKRWIVTTLRFAGQFEYINGVLHVQCAIYLGDKILLDAQTVRLEQYPTPCPAHRSGGPADFLPLSTSPENCRR